MKTLSISASIVAFFVMGMISTLFTTNFDPVSKVVSSKKLLKETKSITYVAPKTTLSGTYHGNGFYTYTNNFTLSSYTNLTFYVATVPNRFLVKDSNGNTVYATSWHGDANYYGPWGASITTSASNPNTFTYGFNAGSYTLYTDTSTNVNNGGSDDSWSVYY